ncbi:hypothetical protein RS9916_26379 [Synechococcus sp. RS9916]|nr:hypothetical protein RS9916_26379 [Synechococcus sp. RS9916]
MIEQRSEPEGQACAEVVLEPFAPPFTVLCAVDRFPVGEGDHRV